MTNLRRILLTGVTLAAAIGANAVGLAPAHAGGPGTVYIYGDTYDQCTTNMSNSIKLQRANGYQVTGVHGCRKTGDGRRYFGDYVVN
ncbi:hypothetical protein [Marmoricola sp. URHB0036]|uniref:hypothetical protein n=1 Tax=Marmoricola sp. URHB0036 TaxID=1298863 RepID=UPI00040D0F9B|nr:hypothetical protein [Marmoricola sp. URHB0036]